MRRVILFVFLLLFNLIAYCQKTTNFGVLKHTDENVIFSVKLKNSNKLVVLCVQKNNRYLVYRFGTQDKMELQYPAVLNANSWRQFRYDGYSRGGGANSAEELHTIYFVNNGISYKLYDDWADGEGSDAGILITVNKKQTNLNGITSTKTGSISLLGDKGKYIANHYWDDNSE